MDHVIRYKRLLSPTLIVVLVNALAFISCKSLLNHEIPTVIKTTNDFALSSFSACDFHIPGLILSFQYPVSHL